MSFGGERGTGQSFRSCSVLCPRAVATSHNEPCLVSCATSRVIIYPPPVVVTFPGPIISTCPQEAVVGSSAALEGGGAAPGTSLRAEILQPEPRAGRSIPRHSPKRSLVKQSPCRAPRCSYVFASRWIHPCSRASSGCSQKAEREEHIPEKEEPQTENMDAGNEDKEALEEPHGETPPEAL